MTCRKSRSSPRRSPANLLNMTSPVLVRPTVQRRGRDITAAGGLLFPSSAGVAVLSVNVSDKAIHVEVLSTASEAACPKRGSLSGRIRSSCLRFPNDMPRAGRRVVRCLWSAGSSVWMLRADRSRSSSRCRGADQAIQPVDLPPVTGRLAKSPGQANRIKMLKRQMCGRAGFHLLRKRTLLHMRPCTCQTGAAMASACAPELQADREAGAGRATSRLRLRRRPRWRNQGRTRSARRSRRRCLR